MTWFSVIGPEALLVLIPLFTFVVMLINYWPKMVVWLTEQQIQRDTHRGIILPLAGFSFSALLGLVAVLLSASDATVRSRLQSALDTPMVYLFVSFILYLFVLNLQGYKLLRWVERVDFLLHEVADLFLILSVTAALLATEVLQDMFWWVGAGAVFFWFLNHIIRTGIMWEILRK